MTPPLHVVFGAGQIGASLARLLHSRGDRVRVVRRGDKPVGAGIEVRAGDARDATFAIAATAGASVVYHCMNPSAYTAATWEAEFPAQGEAIIAAALAANARLVVLDNLYGYGPVEGALTEATPLGATGPKGRVRVAWAERLERARREQGLRYVAGRAGDFFGPGAGDQSMLGANTLRGLAAGKSAWLVGDADQPHAFGYVPDVVEGLAAFGTADADIEGRTFHFPAVQATPRALVAALGAAAGKPGSANVLPGWSLGVAGLFMPILRELRETLYQWERPFLVDDSAFRARFPGIGTNLPDAARQTMAAITQPSA